MLALRRRGRFGLAHVDGHLDFRHAGWSGGIGAVAGEDLAGVTGRLEPELSDIDGLGPYVADVDAVHYGDRENDPGERAALAQTQITVLDLRALRTRSHDDATGSVLGPRGRRRARQRAASRRSTRPRRTASTFAELAALLRELLAGDAIGMQVTVFDPDLDPDGSQAQALTDCLVSALL